MNAAQALVASSAAILLLLGAVHLLYTYVGPKLTPRDPALAVRMREVSPVLTGGTTMWKAWIGFNASHSLGAICFGLVYGYLALLHPAVLFQSRFLLAVGLALLASYAAVGMACWFKVPNTGITLSLLAYAAGAGLSQL